MQSIYSNSCDSLMAMVTIWFWFLIFVVFIKFIVKQWYFTSDKQFQFKFNSVHVLPLQFKIYFKFNFSVYILTIMV